MQEGVIIKIKKGDKIEDVFRKYRKMQLLYSELNKIFPNNDAELEIDLLCRNIGIVKKSHYFKIENFCNTF